LLQKNAPFFLSCGKFLLLPKNMLAPKTRLKAKPQPYSRGVI
jgi:hypothetical protein